MVDDSKGDNVALVPERFISLCSLLSWFLQSLINSQHGPSTRLEPGDDLSSPGSVLRSGRELLVRRKGFAARVERIRELGLGVDGRMDGGASWLSACLCVGGSTHGDKEMGSLIDKVD